MNFKTGKEVTTGRVVRRIAMMLGFECPVDVLENEDVKVPFRNTNGNWILDRGNDWFLRDKGWDVENKMRMWELDFRYMTPELEAALGGMKAFIELELGPRER
jgi:hypothetical protein